MAELVPQYRRGPVDTLSPFAMTRRDPMPQDNQCPDPPNAAFTAHKHTDASYAVPFDQIVTYDSNGMATITITKTLFSSAAATSTQPSSNVSSTSADVAATATTTGTSIIYNTVTVTSTSVSTTSLSSSNNSSDVSTSVASPTTTKPISSTKMSTDAPKSAPSGQSGVVAGSFVGSFAAFGMLGFLIWYLCVKKQASKTFKAKIRFGRRKASDSKTPHLEGQNLEDTRAIMLQQQAEAKQSKDAIGAFLAGAAATIASKRTSPSPGDNQAKCPAARPPWIGLAVSSTTPPNTPPLARSRSQKSASTERSVAPSIGAHPASLMPGFGPSQSSSSSTLQPAPLKTAMKPAPIVTMPQLGSTERLSPLSPRGMFNTVSSTTKGAWKRASQALSPSGYQKMPADGYGGFEGVKGRRESTKSRNPEMEIGAQTDKGWQGQGGWI